MKNNLTLTARKLLAVSRDEKYLQLAIRKAEAGIRNGQTPFGACVVRKDEVLACEHNQVWKNTDITAHAEIIALRVACRKTNSIDLSGATMYSTCEPCPMCLAACHWARIERIVFGAGIADAREYGFNELRISNRELIRKGKLSLEIQDHVLAEACCKLFAYWSSRKNSRSY